LLEKDELNIQRDALEQQKAKLDSDVNEQRSLKTETQNENLQLAATKRQVENDIQIAKVSLNTEKPSLTPHFRANLTKPCRT
jgi:hypothetical protein